MNKKIIILLLLISQINLVKAQISGSDKLDSLVILAISLSEESLFNAQFIEAKKIVQLDYFKNFNGYNSRHEIMLTLQDLRVQGFMNIVHFLPSNRVDNFEKLNNLLPAAQKVKDKDLQGNYFLALSSAYRSIRNIDSALIYEEKASIIFRESRNFRKQAEMSANQISRIHNQLLREGKKEEILALMPKYQEEISFSNSHSKYAMAYNTRHLAQIHRRQTLNYPEALKLFKTSLRLREEIGFKPFIPASYSSLGDVYTKMREYNSAIEMYLKSAELAEEIGFVRYKSYPFLSVGDCYLNQNDKEKALEYYTKALKSASKNNYSTGIDQAIEKISKIARQ